MMRRAAFIAALLLLDSVARADYVWQDQRDGSGFACFDVGSLQVNNGIGTGTRCAAFDAGGNLIPMSVPCGAGTVISVTGANGLVCSPTTPNPTCTLSTTSCATNAFVNATNSGSGLVCVQPTLGNLANIPANTIVCNPAGSAAPPTTSSTLKTDGARLSVGQSTLDGSLHIVTADDTTPMTVAAWDARHAVFGQSSASGGGLGVSYGNGASTVYMTAAVPNVAFVHVQFHAADYGFYVGGTTLGEFLTSSGQVQFPIGDLLPTAITAPGTPSAGTAHVYVESTSKNIAIKNDVGIVNHGAQSKTSVVGTGLAGLNDDGSWATQSFQMPLVACTDYVSLACQGPNSDLGGSGNGDIHAVALHESGGLRIPIGACTTDGQAFVKVAGAMTCRLPTSDLSNDYTAPWVIGIHDGAGSPVDWTTAGQTFAAGQVMVTTSTGNHLATTAPTFIADAVTKRSYAVQAFLGAAVGTCGLFEGGNGLGAGCTLVQYPNDFVAGHVRISAAIASNTITGGTFTYLATLNGGAIAGATGAFTSATTPGVYTTSAIATGSTTTQDVIGLAYQTSAGYTGGFQTITWQVILTP